MTIGDQVGGMINDASSAVSGMAGNLSSTVTDVSNMIKNPSDLLSTVRKMSLPLGGNTFKSLMTTFLGYDDVDDWRVRLNIPLNFFAGSAVFGPLKKAGGFVFPYTPNITISGSAEYEEMNVTHQNFPFLAYKHSKPGEITITGDFTVQNSDEAQYWIACVHFLRSVTKMYSGSKFGEQGSPPPILFLNAYGDYVFNKVPVVVTNFSIDLKNDCDYITTTASHGFDFTDIKGGVMTLLNSSLSADELAGGILAGPLATLTSAVGMRPSSSHVPTRSNITVTLKTAYSRESVRQFSLQSFANGDYVLGGFI